MTKVVYQPVDEVPELYYENYYIYDSLARNQYQRINSSQITADNWMNHLEGIINIMRDGIETSYVQNMFINVTFEDGIDLDLNIFDYYFNLMMWNCIIQASGKVYSYHLFFPDNITQDEIKAYIDDYFIDVYRKANFAGATSVEGVNMALNNMIDGSLHHYNRIDEFSMYLANTINIEDSLDLMNSNPRFKELCNLDLSNIPIEDTKNEGQKATNEMIDIIKNSNHCLADSFRAQEGVNPKQFKELHTHIGSKPDGKGGIFPWIINRSFLNGGVYDVPSTFIESNGGRTAQIIAKCNVGTSGHFARLLGLNNRDTILHKDMNYVCETRNFEKITIMNKKFLKWFNNRYYRFSPNGMEYRLNWKKDTHLIGKTLYFRSPMKCASAARGEGICYRCYGDLAYTNCNINVGQLAAELLSSALTQRMLSAKHLLESLVRKLRWNENLYKFMEINFNILTLQDDFDYNGYKLLIDPESIYVESEDDDFDYNEYVTKFMIKDPEGNIHVVETADSDSIYISNALNDKIRKHGEPVDGFVELDMEKLQEDALFLIYIANDELSKTLEMIKSIINKKSVTERFDADSILQEFVQTVMDGGLNTIAVHLELILSNQLRSIHNILEKPDWSNPNEPYFLTTLNDALTNNPSITVSMSYQKLSKVFYNPLSFRKDKPSFMDLLFMPKPQDYMVNRQLIDTKYKPKSDIEAQRFISWHK